MTASFAVMGFVVPMPTLPSRSILILSPPVTPLCTVAKVEGIDRQLPSTVNPIQAELLPG